MFIFCSLSITLGTIFCKMECNEKQRTTKTHHASSLNSRIHQIQYGKNFIQIWWEVELHSEANHCYNGNDGSGGPTFDNLTLVIANVGLESHLPLLNGFNSPFHGHFLFRRWWLSLRCDSSTKRNPLWTLRWNDSSEIPFSFPKKSVLSAGILWGLVCKARVELCQRPFQTNKQTNKQTDRQTDRQTNKQTNKQTNTHTKKQIMQRGWM